MYTLVNGIRQQRYTAADACGTVANTARIAVSRIAIYHVFQAAFKQHTALRPRDLCTALLELRLLCDR